MGSTTRPTNISAEAWTSFVLRIKGDVLTPEHPDYEEARQAKNVIYNRKPAIVVRAEDAADVSRSIQFARRNGLKFAVKGGGHSIGGHSVNEGGLIIDMRRMNNVRVDPENRTAWAQPGAVAREFLAAVEPHGLAVPFGDAGSVGLGGITLGGGIGYLFYSFKHGHAIQVDVDTPPGNPHIPSLTSLYAAADWHEREASEMVGLVFDGHPNPRNLLLDEDVHIHPLLKAHPLQKAEIFQGIEDNSAGFKF